MQSDDFVITKFINLALQNSDITIYGDGLQTRTFCFIDDNIDTTIKIMEEGLCINDTINIGSDSIVTMIELADMVINIAKSNSNKVYLPPLKFIVLTIPFSKVIKTGIINPHKRPPIKA